VFGLVVCSAEIQLNTQASAQLVEPACGYILLLHRQNNNFVESFEDFYGLDLGPEMFSGCILHSLLPCAENAF
jgi:hypothetical protein